MEDKNKAKSKVDWIQLLGQSISLTILIWAIVSMSGCSKRYHDVPSYMPVNMGNPHNFGVGSFKTSYIADQIDYYYRGTSSGPIGVTTMVNLNDLYSTSAFGRIFAEQLISELVMRGYDVIELRQGDALRFLSDAGEFSLSRDVGSIRKSHDLAAILAGTYIASPETVYVNVRLIDPASSMILSSGSVEVSKNYEVAKLLRGGSMPSSLERIPVKHLAQYSVPLTMFQTRFASSQDDDQGYVSNRPHVQPKIIDNWDISKSKKHGHVSSDASTKVEPPVALK